MLKQAHSPFGLSSAINEGPDPAYYFDADPDPTFQFDADPCESGDGSTTLVDT